MLPEFRLGRGEVFQELEQLQRELNRVFSDAFTPSAERAAIEGNFPVNVYAGPDTVVVTAEVPGVKPDTLELSVDDSVLSIAFERAEPPLQPGASYHRRERTFGKFARAVELPCRVDADKVEARTARGVLQVQVARLEADKPRRITVKSS